MGKDISYFLGTAEEEIVKFPAPNKKKYRDKNGELIMLEVRRLKASHVQEIRDRCTERRIAFDKKKNPLIMGGEVVHETNRDVNKIVNHTIVEALVYPDLKSKELMESFGCVDISLMPMNVFSSNDEYTYVTNKVYEILGLSGSEDEEDDVGTAKN